MQKNYSDRVAENLGELADQADYMSVRAPKFNPWTVHFLGRNIDTIFTALNEGIRQLRSEMGEPLHQKLVQMSAEMRACFDADPEDVTGATRDGRRIATTMAELLDARIRALKARADK